MRLSVMQADQISCLKPLEILDFLLDSPWHPDKGYPFKIAPNGAFFVWVSLPCWFLCLACYLCGAGRFYFYWVRNTNPIPPHAPKTPKTVMQTVMQRLLVYQFTWRLMAYWNNPTNLCSYNTSWMLGNNLYLL